MVWSTKRTIVAALSHADAGLDQVLYRPAVVKAFAWLPRWYLCDLAKLSIRLDERWSTGYWPDDAWVPGDPCDACGRRASWLVYGGVEAGEEPSGDYLDDHPVHTCAWCQPRQPMRTEIEVKRALAQARVDSVSWRWRWRVFR